MIQQFAAQPASGEAVQRLEVLVRTALFKPASTLIEGLLQEAVDRFEAVLQPKPGEVCKGRSALQIQGIFGSMTLHRAYYYHAGKGEGRFPADAALGLEGAYTPALARLLCLEGADESSFAKAANHLLEVGGIAVEGRQIQRVLNRLGEAALAWQRREAPALPCDATVLYVSPDGTGVPMRRAELAGRRGKQADGTAKTRQVCLGCVFTQHTVDQEGRPLRDHASTSYLAGLCSVSDFGVWLRRDALRRGMGGAKETVLLLDGAAGLEKLGQDFFPGCVQIVDFYHALEHLGTVLNLLWDKTAPAYQRRRRRWLQLLLGDGVGKIIADARREARQAGCAEPMEQALGYFEHNRARMQYGSFRARGFFIGSGVIEAGCKTVVGARCKQSGMFWSSPGADNVLAFRCLHLSQRTAAFWKDRANTRAAENDLLPLAA